MQVKSIDTVTTAAEALARAHHARAFRERMFVRSVPRAQPLCITPDPPAPRPAYVAISAQPIVLRAATGVFGDWSFDTTLAQAKPPQGGKITMRDIMMAVSRECDVTLQALKSGRRQVRIVKARQLAMYLSRELTRRTYPEIGRQFGDRDHTTVMHAGRKLEGLLPVARGFLADDASLADIVRSCLRVYDDVVPRSKPWRGGAKTKAAVAAAQAAGQ